MTKYQGRLENITYRDMLFVPSSWSSIDTYQAETKKKTMVNDIYLLESLYHRVMQYPILEEERQVMFVYTI